MVRQAVQKGCPYRKSNPDVMMMESSEQWDGLNAANRLRGAADRCILAERKVGPDLIVIVCIGPKHIAEMPLAKDHDMIETFPRIEPMRRSQQPFCQGDWGAVGRSRMPIARSLRLNTSP